MSGERLSGLARSFEGFGASAVELLDFDVGESSIEP
jgi:hypothetical protein